MVKNPKSPYAPALGRLETKTRQTFGRVAVPFSPKSITHKEDIQGSEPKEKDVVTPRSPLSTTMKGIKNG